MSTPDRNDADLADTTTVAAFIAAVPEPEEAELDRLRRSLADRAAAEGLLDLAYRTVDSPHGTLLVVASPTGVIRLAFEIEDHDAVLDRLGATVSARMLRSGLRTDDAARELDEYFERRRHAFEVSLDLRLARGFRRAVLEQLRTVPYGSTVSYAALAASTGNAGAVRAAASACSHNPVPLIVPCHRVVRSDGSVGKYLGGHQVKVELLAMEASADG